MEDKGMGGFDRQGKFNMGLDSQLAQYTAEEQNRWPSVDRTHPYDHYAWSVVSNHHVQNFPHHKGLWALKGDRRHGIDVTIPGVVDLVITRGEWNGKLVWEVHLNNLESATRAKAGGKVKGLFGKR
jgi:hypothetical protein